MLIGRPFVLGTFLLLLLVASSQSLACRGSDPKDLKDVSADAIVLTTIKDVHRTGAKQAFPDWSPAWVATASVEAQILGKVTEKEIEFPQRGPGDCDRISEPKVGKYYVLYLRKVEGKYYPLAMPYWWVKVSGDPRVAKLRKYLPLGPVRDPTPDEALVLDFAEPRVTLPRGKRELERYTRIYARSSASAVTVAVLPSQTPKRLMLDTPEELPTLESCGCAVEQQIVDLDDLWNAGKLPPFNP